MRDSFWEDQADSLQHALLYNLLKTAKREDLARLAGESLGDFSGNTASSVLAVLRARLERAEAQRQLLMLPPEQRTTENAAALRQQGA